MSPALDTDSARKAAEALLQREGFFSEKVLGTAPGLLFLCDELGAFLRWNKLLEEISGYSAGELAGMQFADLFSEGERVPLEESLAETLRTGESSVEADLLTKEGRAVPFFFATRRIVFDEVACLMGVGVDTTGRAQAQLALRESERKYRELVEHANSIILRWTRDGHVTFLNEYGLKFFGYASEEIVGCHVVGTIVPEIESTNRDLRPLMEQILENPQAFEQNTNENMRRNGERVWIAWTNKIVPDEQGGIKEVLSIGTDITERKRAEEQVAEQAAFLDKARDAIMACCLEGKILFWNQGAENLYGWKRGEVLGRHLCDVFQTDPTVFEGINRQVLARGEWTGELRHQTKARQEIIVESRRNLIRDKIGNPRSVLVINTDITEKKKIEAQFLRAQRLESIGTLAGGIAHDLNNILTPILISIDVLQNSTLDPQAKKTLETIGVSAKRGADIVRQVLSFARGIEGERIEIQPRHLLRDLEQIIKNTFPKDVRLRFSIPHDVWTVVGDPTQMQQVLLNLCVNARDAMPSGGDLNVAIENCVINDPCSGPGVPAKPGRYIKFCVTDKGTGIPPEILDKIFEPFFTTKDVNKGTGLGLSTVSAIVKSHNGLIEVHSEVGKGTSFDVYFPATEATSEPSSEPTENTNLPRGKGETILLIDDEAPILAVAGQTLRAFGYRVLVASDGADALVLYAQYQNIIAAVLTDMTMPVLDGAVIIQALRTMNPAVKIIAASGLHANGAVARQAGARLFMLKPYTADTLLKALRSVIDAR